MIIFQRVFFITLKTYFIKSLKLKNINFSPEKNFFPKEFFFRMAYTCEISPCSQAQLFFIGLLFSRQLANEKNYIYIYV